MSQVKRLGLFAILLLTALASTAAPVDGYWLGTLNAGNQKLRLQLNVESDDSGLRCKLDSLDQMAFGLDCGNVKLTGDDFSFDVPSVAGRWTGKLSGDRKLLSGMWSQGLPLPLVFERQSALQAPPARKPPTYSPALPPVSAADMQAVLTKDFETSLKSGQLAPGTGVGVTIGVLRDGERRVFSFGAAKPDSLFEIGSITKTFTGLVLAQMIEQQQVTPDQAVRSLLPPDAVPKPDGPEVSLLDLVTQHSGLPRMPRNFIPANPTNPYIDYRAAHLYAFLAQQGLAKPANAAPVYSNLGFGLLGQALANRAEVDYATLVAQRVTGPLCMTDTVVKLDEPHKSRFIQGLQNDRKPAGQWDFDALAGAGAIRSTADDMLKYLAAQLQPAACASAGNAPYAQTLPEAIKRSQALQADMPPTMKIAYAWMFVPSTGSYWHNGGTGGYSSFAFFNPQRRYAAVVLTNLAIGPQGSLADSIGQHIRQRFGGEPAIEL